MARFTDGVIQMDAASLNFDNIMKSGMASNINTETTRRRNITDYQNKRKKRKKK
jgi:hypothetical protein